MNPTELIDKINHHFSIDITKKSKERIVVFSRYIFFEIVKNSHTNWSMNRIALLLNQKHERVSEGLQRCIDLQNDSEFLEIKKQIIKL
jgi:hypothetical protein